MIDKIEALANAWGITPEQMRQVAERFGCLSCDGRAVLTSLLHYRIEEYAAPPD